MGGSADKFRDFVERTSPGFLRTAYALLGDRGAAEDATQVALLRTYRHWGRASQRPGGYAWQVLVNVCRDERRRRGRSPAAEEPTDVEAPTSKGLDTALADRLDLGAALGRLPYAQREVVVLRYYLELPVAETARVGLSTAELLTVVSKGLS